MVVVEPSTLVTRVWKTPVEEPPTVAEEASAAFAPTLPAMLAGTDCPVLVVKTRDWLTVA
jgi:hypothetical protein